MGIPCRPNPVATLLVITETDGDNQTYQFDISKGFLLIKTSQKLKTLHKTVQKCLILHKIH